MTPLAQRLILVRTQFYSVLQSLRRRKVWNFVLIRKHALFQIRQNITIMQGLDPVATNPRIPLSVRSPNFATQKKSALTEQ
jgi:hypothetical protein